MGPFSSAPPSEVALSRAPLARVVAQIRFPAVLSVGDQGFVASFQEQIRSAYPILRTEQTQGFAITPMGLAPTKPEVTWRFVESTENWTVSLAPTFLSLETKRYTSREDFIRRLRALTEALQAKIDPKFTDRIGVRYVNRLSGEDLKRLTNFVRPEVLGLLSEPSGEHGEVVHHVSEMLADTAGTKLAARWGVLPPNQSFDPSAIEPLPQSSWFLDIDSFVEKIEDANIDSIIARATDLSEKAYTFFRWAMKDEFIESRRGG